MISMVEQKTFEKVASKKSGLNFKFIDYKDFSKIDNLISSKTKMIWVESPTNSFIETCRF